MSSAARRLQTISDGIAAATKIARRDPSDVRLIAVSKGRSVDQIEELIAAGQRVDSPSAVLNASRLAVTVEALGESYDHVVLDGGAVPEIPAERFAQLAQTAVLVVSDPAHRQAAAARKRLEAAGFAEITMLVATG